jgi:dolichol kinase
LVARNSQPADGQVSLLRKLLHAAMAIVPAAGWWLAPWAAVVLAGLFLVGSLAVEVARRRWPGINRWLWRLLPSVFRDWEDDHLLGSTWFAAGVAGALLLFGVDAGGVAVLFLAWGDPVAEVVGRQWGGLLEGKTLAGTAGCLVVCLVAAGVGVSVGGLHPLAAIAGAVVAALVERWSPPPDDNLWMPILSGLAVAAGQWLVGGHSVLFTLWH